MVLHGPFIYINGYPGVGKLTIANELSKLIPNSKVVDNHLLIDPAAAVLDRSDPEYQDLRKTIRQGVLDKIATTKSTKDVTFIFTDQQSSNELGAMVAKEYQDAAFKRGCRFITVVLKCDLKENVRRMEGESRVGATKTKLKDAHVLKKIRDAEDICSFGGPNELKLDVTDLTPEKAAQKINEHWLKVRSTWFSLPSVASDLEKMSLKDYYPDSKPMLIRDMKKAAKDLKVKFAGLVETTPEQTGTAAEKNEKLTFRVVDRSGVCNMYYERRSKDGNLKDADYTWNVVKKFKPGDRYILGRKDYPLNRREKFWRKMGELKRKVGGMCDKREKKKQTPKLSIKSDDCNFWAEWEDEKE